VAPLRAIAAAGYDVPLAVTRADKRRGRGGAMQPSPVKLAAGELGIRVSHRVDDALEADAELGVLVAFGRLIKRHVLEQLPIVNMHFSLLPRWRGAAPVERAILAGDRETGVCLMQLVEELDAGPVYGCTSVPIHSDAGAGSLREALVVAGTGLLLEHLGRGFDEPVAQHGTPTYAEKLDPSDFALDWSRPAQELDRIVRAGDGRAFTSVRGKRLKVHRAQIVSRPDSALAPGEMEAASVGTGDGRLRLIEVQPEGKARQTVDSWLHGARLGPGERLGV
jgi:methionyl-tRNA formyltransferase